MSSIVFIDVNGERREVEAENGQTLMEVALENNVEGILADCGGACACATCHVFIERKFWPALGGEPHDQEAAMLGAAFAYDEETSRLSCQLQVTDEIDGLVVEVADNA